MDDGAVEAIRDRRAGGAAGCVALAEHEVVDEKLRPSAEQIRERCAPLLGLEAVVLLDAHPGQLLPPPRELVAATGQFLLVGQ